MFIIFPEFSGRNSHILSEALVKMTWGIVSHHLRNFGNGMLCGDQQGLRLADLSAQDILHGCIAQHIFEYMGNIGLAESQIGGHSF